MKVVDCSITKKQNDEWTAKVSVTDDVSSIQIRNITISRDLVEDTVKVRLPNNFSSDNELFRRIKDTVLKEFSKLEEREHFLEIFGV